MPATGDEVQELAQTLNQMLARLAAGAKLQDNSLAAAAHELRTLLACARCWPPSSKRCGAWAGWSTTFCW